MTSATQEAPVFSLNDRVTISQGDEHNTKLTGKIVRVWDKPAKDPYVTVKTDDGRTFVRCASATRKA